MLLLALAVAPGIAICLFFFARDRFNREPAWNMSMSFILGILSVIPAFFIEQFSIEEGAKALWRTIIDAYILVALVEEASKFLALRYYSFTRRGFDEPLDGIIYSVLVSMGFATLENVGYVLLDEENGWYVGVMRMFTSVPAHATFAIIMGYYVGKAKFDLVNKNKLLLKGLLGAALVHGTYDAFLFSMENKWLKQYVSEILLFVCAIISLVVAVRMCHKLIKLHQLTSQQLFKTGSILTIRHASIHDIDLIRTLTLQVWPQTYSSILSKQQIIYMLDMMYSKEALKEQMLENNRFIIVYNAGIPVGFASYSEIEHTVYKLNKIYILPIHQARGTGKFVIEQIINDIVPGGATALQLNVNRNNNAIGFYEKMGFEVIRTEDVDIGNNYFMNDFIMEKRLVKLN